MLARLRSVPFAAQVSMTDDGHHLTLDLTGELTCDWRDGDLW